MKNALKRLVWVIALIAPVGESQAADCWQGLCVGDTAMHVARLTYRWVGIVAIDSDRRFVIRFFDTGRIEGDWQRPSLALAQGCLGRFCVGDRAYNRERDYRRVTVLALQWSGRYVLRFDDDGAVGGYWREQDLVSFDSSPPALEWVCRLVTPHGSQLGYSGRGETQELAFSRAVQGCLEIETPYQCRKNGEMRCWQEISSAQLHSSFLR